MFSSLALLTAIALWLTALPALAQTSLGHALSFDGVDDFMVVTNFGMSAPMTEVTIEFWQRAAAAKKQVTLTLAPDYGATNRIYAAVPWEDGAVYWEFGNSTNGGRLSYVPTNSILGTWQHFALVASQSGNYMRIYRNGVLEAEKAGMTPFVRGALNLQLGGSSTVAGIGPAFFRGELDEVRIWNVVRSQTEITNTMLQPLAGTEANLVAHYRFEEAAGIRAYDASTNHLGGTLVNRPRRVISWWRPAITFNTPNPLTNECHTTFVETTTVNASPQAIVASAYHNLALKADGTVVSWGNNDSGQTNSPASTTNVVAIAAGYYHNLVLKANGTVVGWGNNTYGQTNSPASATNVVAIAAGYCHNLALKTNGMMVAWGYNDYGQTTIPASATNVVAIAAGGYHSLALRADGTIAAWGRNNYGQTTIPAAATNVVAIAAGFYHNLALKANGTIVGWGYNDAGQTTIPASATNVVAVAAGNSHNLALKADGTIVGWGNDSSGQTTLPASATNVVAIAAGGSHSLALKADGTFVGWGSNYYGQTTNPGSLYTLNLPLIVNGSVNTNSPGIYLLNYSTTNAAGTADMAIRTVIVADTLPPVLTLVGDNPLMHNAGVPFTDPGATAIDLCEGDSTMDIRISGVVDTNVPGNYSLTYSVTDAYGNAKAIVRTVVVGLSQATTLSASDLLNDAATLNGTVHPHGVDTVAWFEWGASRAYGYSTPPTAVSGTTLSAMKAGLTNLTAGLVYHYRVVTSNSVSVAYGADQVFWIPALSIRSPNPLTNECHLSFVDPGIVVNASPMKIAAGGYHSLALKGDGTVLGWGYNYYRQTNNPASATNVVEIAAGGWHSLALKADGLVLGWGNNGNGQTNSPLSASNVVAIAAGNRHSLALKADGSVVSWGDNFSGQTNSPPSATNVVAIAAGGWHNLALKADGSVIAWGNNDSGQTNIPGSATNVVAIAAGGAHNLALKADGTVLAWGGNTYGQLAIPIDATNVVAIAAGDCHSLALRADGMVIGWGAGQLGTSGSPHYGQATIPVNATNVVAIAAGGSHSLALKAEGTVVGWGYNVYGQATTPANATELNLPIQVHGRVDTNSPGIYPLTYSTTNALGAASTDVRSVIVVDTRAPVLTLVGNNPQILEPGMPFADPGATATDLCAGDLTGSIIVSGTVDTNVPGNYLLSYSVTDAFGNAATAVRTVAVGFPVATTLPASGLLKDTATFNGTANPRGADSTACFEWGTSRAYGERTIPVPVGSGTTPVAVNAAMSGLAPGLTHHFRLVVSNCVGVARGADQTFWIPALSLKSSNPLTNECHVTFADPGAGVSVSPLAIAAGALHNLVLKGDGTVAGWGAGTNDTQKFPTMGQVMVPSSATNVVAVAAGAAHSLALRADGTVLGWGDNLGGQASSPAAATNVTVIAAGDYFSLALRSDGTVVGWGNNGDGQATVPAGATNVVAIAGGYAHSLALRNNGTVVAWGDNDYGQATVPAGATNVTAIAAGEYHSLALKADGRVVSWGYNYYGQTNLPASATNVVAIAAGDNHNLVLKADGTIVGWGNNSQGQTTIPASATNVVAIAAGAMHSLALKADGTLIGWGISGGYNYYGQNTIPSSVTNLNLPIRVRGGVDTNSPGIYMLTYSTTNALGAVGEATRTVVVADTRPPLLSLLGSNPLVFEAGAPFVEPGANASDLCAGDLTSAILTNQAVNPNIPGTYTNSYSVADASGNVAATNRIVNVIPPRSPVIGNWSVPAPGRFRLQATGAPNVTYTLQTSTDLVHWADHTNVATAPTGLMEYQGDQDIHAPACFYRLKWP